MWVAEQPVHEMLRFDGVPTTHIDLDALAGLLEEAPVTVGILFGSFARGDENERSDVDLAVAFDESLTSQERTAARLDLLTEVSVELGTDDIDVVPLSGASPELLAEIRRDGVLILGRRDGVEAIMSDVDASASAIEFRSALDELIADLGQVV